MSDKQKSLTAYGFAKPTLVLLILGGLYGSVEAVLSIGPMLNSHDPEFIDYGVFSFPYRVLIGASFFSQIFLAAWLILYMMFPILPATIREQKKRPGTGWAGALFVVLGFALPLLVAINNMLPGFKTKQSILGNLIFAATCFVCLLAFASLLERTKISKALSGFSKVKILLIVIEAVFVLILLTADNEPVVDREGRNPPDPSLPNIVLITVDTLRADHVSAYGYKKISTPNFDRIGKGGVIFERPIAPTSWTLPTLATMHTGLNEYSHGMNRHDVRLNKDVRTLAEILGEKGYATYAVVTNEFLNHAYGLDQGFDTYVFSRDHTVYSLFEGLFIYDFLFANKAEKHNAQNMTTRAIKLLERVNHRPFFFWIHYIDPHTPYGAWYIDRYPEYDKGYTGRLGKEFDSTDKIESGELAVDDLDKRHILALYDAEIMYTDKHVGRLLDLLEKEKFTNTAVIFTSDHGEEFWEHGGMVHGRKLYTESVHVPLMIKYPGSVKPGTFAKGTFAISDIFATLCDLGGVAIDNKLYGVSLLRQIDNDANGPVFVMLDKDNPDGGRYLASGQYSQTADYLRHEKPEMTMEAFNPGKDKGQHRNLIDSGEMTRDAAAEIVDYAIESELNRKDKLGSKKGPDKIKRLTPEMQEALRGLGYLN